MSFRFFLFFFIYKKKYLIYTISNLTGLKIWTSKARFVHKKNLISDARLKTNTRWNMNPFLDLSLVHFIYFQLFYDDDNIYLKCHKCFEYTLKKGLSWQNFYVSIFFNLFFPSGYVYKKKFSWKFRIFWLIEITYMEVVDQLDRLRKRINLN